ncbi:MAG TPA: hypothetical protein VHM31_00660 [Polyangia bacterium]|nr:hypothetical protein [Polyangia bacterium]
MSWRAGLFCSLWAALGAGACKTDIPRTRAGDAAGVDRPVDHPVDRRGDAPVADAPPTGDARAAADGAAACVLDADCGQLERCAGGRCVRCTATCTSNAACVAGAVCVHHNLCSSCQLRDAGVH